MEKINTYIRSQHVEIDDIVDELLNVPQIKKFVFDNELTSASIEPFINVLMNFKKLILENENKDLNQIEFSKDLIPYLVYYNNCIKINYRKSIDSVNNANKKYDLIKTLSLPKKILEADLSDFYMETENRRKVYRYINRFITLTSQNEYVKGMYIHGQYGTGKTYVLACLANELSKKGIESMLVYYPDLVRELKSSIHNGTLEEKINMLKTTPVLLLDDIGGENPSVWVRDEILGPILQYRLLDELPTFFTSNMHAQDLMHNLITNDSIKEKTKAMRIYERIRNLVVEFQLREKPRQ